MKIVVLVKDVPDTYEERSLHLETGLADRASSESVLDEICERALEAALRHADDHDGVEVVALTMAPIAAEATTRKALAIGASRAVHVVDDALVGADLGLTAEVLAAAIDRGGFDLVIAGNQSTDGSSGMLAAMIAELLDWAHASSLDELWIGDDAVEGTRAVDGGAMRIRAELPAVISVTDGLPEARFPTTRDGIAARRKPLERLSPSDLGVEATSLSVPRSIMLAVAQQQPRGGGVTVAADDDAGARLADFLIERGLVEGHQQ